MKTTLQIAAYIHLFVYLSGIIRAGASLHPWETTRTLQGSMYYNQSYNGSLIELICSSLDYWEERSHIRKDLGDQPVLIALYRRQSGDDSGPFTL